MSSDKQPGFPYYTFLEEKKILTVGTTKKRRCNLVHEATTRVNLFVQLIILVANESELFGLVSRV